MTTITRRSLLAGVAAGAAVSSSLGTRISHAQHVDAQPLRIPELIDARREGNSISLTAQRGQTAFFPGQGSGTRGFNGAFNGPTLRLHRGDEVEIAVTNTMPDETAVHWHGLLVPAEADGGPHQTIETGTTWRPRFKIDQPAATLWYHAHVHGQTARQVYEGLAGVILIADEAERALGLPSDYGVDDIPLLLQDRLFDSGRLVYPTHPMFMMHGVRGDTVLVNGTANPVARVPRGLLRLRIVNGSNARVYDLAFSDGRSFHWIASDAGLLERPVERRSLWLAPGERAELLVDLSDGRPVALHTGPDPTLDTGMMGMMGGVADFGARYAEVVNFVPAEKAGVPVRIPERLSQRERLDVTKVSRRRRLVLTMGMGGMGPGMMGGGRGPGMMGGMGMGRRPGMMGMFGIDGRPFDMERVDQVVRLGASEIWEVAGEMMAHPFHIHGVHFEVLSRDGERPALSDQGSKDTVLIRGSVELLVQFSQPAVDHPFMYHCHTLEHEDGGMMGQYRTA
jgi:blue copper oxidase